MTEPNAASPEVALAAAGIKKGKVVSEESLLALLTIMAAKEARIAEKEAALEESLKARDKQRRRDSENYTRAKIELQKACRHLKGGKGRQRGQQKDPAVFLHTFTRGDRVIKCMLCGARWLPGDTRDYLKRNGSEIPNWTNIGWAEASELAEDSSNKPSSSERFGEAPVGALPKTKEGNLPENLQI